MVKLDCTVLYLISQEISSICKSRFIHGLRQEYTKIYRLFWFMKSSSLSQNLMTQLTKNLIPKKIISTQLMIEQPVRSPIVPPIADNLSSNVVDLYFVSLIKDVVSK